MYRIPRSHTDEQIFADCHVCVILIKRLKFPYNTSYLWFSESFESCENILFKEIKKQNYNYNLLYCFVLSSN